jgi:formylglycine-generating enzyme required for sulfatase activity
MLWAARLAMIAVLSVFPELGFATSLADNRPLTPSEERGLKPGDDFRECPACPRMVVLPAGKFLMGSPDDEPMRDSDEGPQIEVTIARPFAVAKFELSFDEWDACVADGGCNGYRPSDAGWGRGRQPVIIVSWDDAKAYVAWLSRKTGHPYRLLSEAEWEYAARGGTNTVFSWGAAISSGDANYDASLSYPGSPRGEMRQRTVPVDSFKPNGFGLHNMHGNVWEWVEDCWHRRYSEMPAEVRRTGSAWVSKDCEARVFRGGSWADAPHVLRAANRGRYEPFIRNTSSGIRVGRTIGP